MAEKNKPKTKKFQSKKEGSRRVQSRMFEPLPCHDALLLACSELYNIASYHLSGRELK